MALPKYDKSKRRKSFEQLPKGAYVIKILNAVEEENKSKNGSHLTISFDIAEGEYEDFYSRQYMNNSNEDKRWPNDAIYRLTVPTDGCKEFIWTNYNSFFADLEDSNNGYLFGGDPRELKNKLLGGKFRIEQTEFNGKIYDHTRLQWTCVADDVRNGTAGSMPADKMIQMVGPAPTPSVGAGEWLEVPKDIEMNLPFN